ncbi:hypothetical protein NR798_27320 [Archangium gephyra]|uniref:hypothetical protein n=1 Tax=Archangium gephyra TaxID=48 RepID=UPI0035D40A50
MFADSVQQASPSVKAAPLAVGDPTTSIPRVGAFPEAQPLTGDLLTGSFQVSSTATGVTASLAPFVLAQTPSFFLLDSARIELRSGGALNPWGATLSTGYSSAAQALHPTSKQTQEIWERVSQSCLPMTGEQEEVIRSLTEQLNSTIEQPVARDPKDSLNFFAGKVLTAWKNLPSTSRREPVIASQLKAAQKAYVEGVGNCAAKIFDAERVKEAFNNGFSVLGKVGFDWFPYVSGPALPDANNELQKPTPHAYQGHFVGLDAGYFPTSNFAIWVSVAFADTRAKVTDAQRRGRLSEGVTFGWKVPISSLTSAGFQPALGVGGFIRGTQCQSDQGCPQTFANYKDPLAIKSGLSYGGYLELRASSTVQVQLALPVDTYDLASAIGGSDGTTTVKQIIPTLSVTVTSWSL